MAKRIAHIDDGVVVNVTVVDDDFEPNGGNEIESETAGKGWIVSNGALVPPPAPAPTPDDLRVYAAARRYDVEVAGVSVAVSSGTRVFATDRESQSKVMAVFLQASFDSGYSVVWKTNSGFVTLTNADILAVSNAVRDHIQNAFAAEATAVAGIEADTITTFAQIEALLAG